MSKILRQLLLLTFILCAQSCHNDRSKSQILWTHKVCDKLYVETYQIVGGGAGGADRVSEYLTDSSNFSIYIGTFIQDVGSYKYECKGDTIKVTEIRQINAENKITKIDIYSLSSLKKEKRNE